MRIEAENQLSIIVLIRLFLATKEIRYCAIPQFIYQ